MTSVTGSRLGSLCYLVQRKDFQEAFQMLWDIKNDRRSAFTKDPSRLFAIQWGIRTEDEAFHQFTLAHPSWKFKEQEKTLWLDNVKVFQRTIGARSDGTYTRGDQAGVVEIKCPLRQPHDRVPIHYIVQMFLEMKAYKVKEACFVSYYQPRGWQELLGKLKGDDLEKERTRPRLLMGRQKRQWTRWIQKQARQPETPMPSILRSWKIHWHEDVWFRILLMCRALTIWGENPSQQNASMTLKAIKLVLSEIHEKVKVERIFADHHDRRMTRSMKRLVSISE